MFTRSPAVLTNPFGAVTFLLLPAVLWIWIVPGRGPFRRVANGLLVLLGFLVVVLLFVQYAADLRIGGDILWYVFMALAYAQFTPGQIILTFCHCGDRGAPLRPWPRSAVRGIPRAATRVRPSSEHARGRVHQRVLLIRHTVRPPAPK